LLFALCRYAAVADEALTIAAILSHRSPFMAPPSKRDEADAAKRSFAVGGAAQSDHLTVGPLRILA
jgi:ATP-dependent RNA helicase DHX57